MSAKIQRLNITCIFSIRLCTLYLPVQLDIRVFKLFTPVANLADNERHTSSGSWVFCILYPLLPPSKQSLLRILMETNPWMLRNCPWKSSKIPWKKRSGILYPRKLILLYFIVFKEVGLKHQVFICCHTGIQWHLGLAKIVIRWNKQQIVITTICLNAVVSTGNQFVKSCKWKLRDQN